MGSTPRGGTRWKRFAVVMVPSVAAAAAVGIGLAQGALAASITVSGQQFKVRAGYLYGEGFAQYGGVVEGYKEIEGDAKEQHPVAISTFTDARIDDLCQSLATDVPGLGTVYMRLDAGNEESVIAEQLYLDIAQLEADATFTDIDIGVAVRDKTWGPEVKNQSVKSNAFSQQAKVAELNDARQTAWATTAGTFKLNGLKLRLGTDKDMECF